MGNGLPVWVRPGSLAPDNPEMVEALQLGAAVSGSMSASSRSADPAAVLQAFNVHGACPGGRVI